MTNDDARELLASCKRQRDVWRIAGTPPSPEAVARVERDELPRCRRVACDRLATVLLRHGAFPLCDGCLAGDVARGAAHPSHADDLPHAAALRAALAKGGAR